MNNRIEESSAVGKHCHIATLESIATRLCEESRVESSVSLLPPTGPQIVEHPRDDKIRPPAEATMLRYNSASR